MKCEIVTLNYQVSLSNKQFDILDGEDGYEILQVLEKTGAFRIDWSGHYGSNIFFSCKAEELDLVLKEIEKQLI